MRRATSLSWKRLWLSRMARATRCLLIVAVPVTREEFDADIQAGTDLMRTFAHGRQTRNEDVLWGIYEKTLRELLRVSRRVGRRGVTIQTRGTVDMFTDAMATYEVVTAVAHWRSARYRPADVRDPDQVADLVR